MKKRTQKPIKSKAQKELLRQHQDKLSFEKKLFILCVLSVVCILFALYPLLAFELEPKKVYLWALILFVLIFALIMFCIYPKILKIENQKYEKYNSLRIKANNMLQRYNEMKTENQKYWDDKLYAENRLENERDAYDELNKAYDDLWVYKKHLESIYILGQGGYSPTRQYALKCFERSDTLKLFDVIRYLTDKDYARCIDTNAEEWTVKLSSSNSLTMVINDIEKIIKNIKKTYGGTTSPSVPIREHGMIEKKSYISKGDER